MMSATVTSTLAHARRAFNRCLEIALLVPLAACVGLLVESADYRPVTIAPERKAEVLARFGEPLRREARDGFEVWSYKLVGQGVAGQAVASTGSVAYLVLFPVVSTSELEHNFRVHFKGDDVMHAEERRSTRSGIACGVPSHAFPDGCHAGLGRAQTPAEPTLTARYGGLPLALRGCPSAPARTDCTCRAPDYPSAAARRGEQGSVRLALIVAPDDSVSAIEVVQSSGSRSIDLAALDHFRGVCFKAARNDAGEPVSSVAFVLHHWRLP